MSDLLPVEAAWDRLIALAPHVESETVPVTQAAGRWLAEDVIALRTQPDADLSAMDGYALRYAELPGLLTVIGESTAGAPLDRALGPGEAARIFTGAVVPDGADTILVQEEALREGDTLRLDGAGPPAQGAHIRRSGNDFVEGETLIASGLRLTAARLGLAIAAGHGALSVARPVRVAILATGNELREPGAACVPGEIPASNGSMLKTMLANLPIEINDLGIVRDEMAALGATIDHARDADILVTIGGVSVGDYDLVRPALEQAGADLSFWRIAMKPGKPLMAGRIGDLAILGLPGNPASAFVTAKLFVEPLIAAAVGAANPLPRFLSATLGTPLPATHNRAEFLRGQWRNAMVEPVDEQSSASLTGLASAELLIARAPHAAPAMTGETVRILPFA